ncbi:MAG: DNA repair protein RadC [Chitinophagales bacterium]|nr:DNA repair protein RadC [Chitinophagales bacterium]
MTYNTQYSAIKCWAEEDRPREKLILNGRHYLTDVELLAILIGSGTKNRSALELAREILSITDNNLVALGEKSLSELQNIKGIGQAKAVTIAAALELGRRRQKQSVINQQKVISAKTAYELLAPTIADLPHEEFWVILLNRRNILLKHKKITQGGYSGTIVDIRQIFNWAISEKAASMILAHNHPSGTLSPSEADTTITNRICQAGNLLDIKVIDHIIVTNRGYYSFSEKGQL